MAVYILRRLLATIPVLLGVATATFFIVHILPGDPIQALLGTEDIDPVQVAKLREELGLTDSLPVQYVRFMSEVVRGDLGNSLLTNRPVTTQIMEQFPSTIRLAMFSLVFAVVFGVVLGVIAAVKHLTVWDNVAMLVSVVGIGIPNFFLGILLIFLFAVQLRWLPATSGSGLQSLLLPGIALGTGSGALLARLTRSSMLEVMRMDYVTTARAKGLTERTVILKHAMRNALIPVVTTMGVLVGRMLAGAIVIETVFARPGLGRLLIDAIFAKDAPVVQGAILFSAVFYVMINLVVDLSYGFLDPRIRYS